MKPSKNGFQFHDVINVTFLHFNYAWDIDSSPCHYTICILYWLAKWYHRRKNLEVIWS